MKYIKFNKLSVKNFLSVGDEPVQITFDSGINIITGINKDKSDRRNGVGKSTIADAIYFTIFGTTLRDIKKDNIPNNTTSGQTETHVEFTVTENERSTDYSIVRILNPSKCYIYKDGVDKTRDSISNTSKYIADLLSSTPDVFQNCVIMTLNNTVPFMAQKKNDKRKFIEGILNLQVFGDMLQLAKSEYNEYGKQLEIECSKYETTSSQIESLTAQKDKQMKSIREQIHKLETRKTYNDKEIENLEGAPGSSTTMSVSDYQESIKKLNENLSLCSEKYTTLVSKKSSVETSSKHVKDMISKITTGEKTCPACLRPLDDHDKEHIQHEIDTLTDQITGNNTRVQELKVKITTVTQVKSKLKDSIILLEQKIQKQELEIKEKDNNLKRINQLRGLNAEIDNDINEAKTNRTSFDELIKQSTDRLDVIQVEIDKLKHTINKLDVVKFVVSEEGVRSYIVKKILQLMNGKLAYYLKKMDANCMCVFNEYFEEQIIDEKGKICSYHNFSGAERKNIDLACLFAFMDIRRMQGDVAFNFSVYDELLDSSLDERGIELVLDILKERVEKYDECVMVISHRKESVKHATNNPILLEKTNGITRRVATLTSADK
jgi:DNA repair exonuclease SbcCD ATPase subunit